MNRATPANLESVLFSFGTVQVQFEGDMVRVSDRQYQESVKNEWTNRGKENHALLAGRQYKPRSTDAMTLANAFLKGQKPFKSLRSRKKVAAPATLKFNDCLEV